MTTKTRATLARWATTIGVVSTFVLLLHTVGPKLTHLFGLATTADLHALSSKTAALEKDNLTIHQEMRDMKFWLERLACATAPEKFEECRQLFPQGVK